MPGVPPHPKSKPYDQENDPAWTNTLELAPEPETTVRFKVINLDTHLYGVLDQHTKTLREVTADEVDAMAVAGQLNTGKVYALGRRWNYDDAA